MLRLVFFLLLFGVWSKVSASSLPDPILKVTDQWDKFVSKYVDKHGGVDYVGINAKFADLKSIVDAHKNYTCCTAACF